MTKDAMRISLLAVAAALLAPLLSAPAFAQSGDILLARGADRAREALRVGAPRCRAHSV